MIPEYANGCNADLTSTSTVCFEDYANSTHAPPTSPAPSTVPQCDALCHAPQGMRNATSVVTTLASAKIVGQMSSHILFGENTHTYLQLGTTLTSSGLRKNYPFPNPSKPLTLTQGSGVYGGYEISNPYPNPFTPLPPTPRGLKTPGMHYAYPICAAQRGIILGRMCVACFSDMPVSDNDEQCALRPDGTLKDMSEIPWLNDPDDTEPISAHGLGAPSLNLDSDTSTTAGLKGKEPAQLVGSCHAIKPTTKAQQASLTGFFSTRTVLVGGKESAQTSSANSANSGPSKQGGSTPTAGKGTQKCTKASVSAGPKSASRPLQEIRMSKAIPTTTKTSQSVMEKLEVVMVGTTPKRRVDMSRCERMLIKTHKVIRRTYSRTNDPRTRDICQVFSEEAELDVDGQKKTGCMCEICNL
ncbi:hypothetical protein EDB86DRAFT_2832778 [Lactarius hatsudake]|nr:hypothetical protein EDB86DRAFT_2832778 [Lactarius hatsudake]